MRCGSSRARRHVVLYDSTWHGFRHGFRHGLRRVLLVAPLVLLSACFGTFNEPVIGVGNPTVAAFNPGLRFSESDQADLVLMNLLTSAPAGGIATWRSNETLTFGTYQVSDDFLDSFGRFCRDYTELVNVDGRQDMSRATACRDRTTGDWHRVYLPIRQTGIRG